VPLELLEIKDQKEILALLVAKDLLVNKEKLDPVVPLVNLDLRVALEALVLRV